MWFDKLRDRKKTLVKETFVYTATDAFGRAMGFLLLPFVSYYMPPDELGIATNFTVLTTIITLLAGQAVVNALPYFFYEQNKEQNKKMVSNLLLICVVCCVFLLVLTIFLKSIVFHYLKLNTHFQLLASVTVMASLVNSTSLVLLRLENKPINFATLQLIQIFLHCATVVWFVIILKWGGAGKIYSDVTVPVTMSFIHFTYMHHKGYINFEYERKMVRKLLKFGLPLVPHSISFWLKVGMDKIFITSFCGLYSNGLYSMALTITSLYSVVSNAFFSAYTPYLQKTLASITPETEKSEKQKIVKLTYLLFGLFFVLAILSIFGGWVILYFIVDSKYQASFVFVPWLILGLYIYAIYSFTIQFIYKQKKTLVMGVITFSASIIHIIMAYFFIKHWGVMGAVYSGLLSTFLTSIAIAFYSEMVYPMPWFSFISKKPRP